MIKDKSYFNDPATPRQRQYEAVRSIIVSNTPIAVTP